MDANSDDFDLVLIKEVKDKYINSKKLPCAGTWNSIGAKLKKPGRLCMQRWVELRKLYGNFFQYPTPDRKFTPVLRELQAVFQEQQFDLISLCNSKACNMDEDKMHNKSSSSTANDDTEHTAMDVVEIEDDAEPSYSDVPKPFDEFTIKTDDNECWSDTNDLTKPIDLDDLKEEIELENSQLNIDIIEEGIIGLIEKEEKKLQNNKPTRQKLNKIRRENMRLKKRLNKIDKSSVYLFYESIADKVLTFPKTVQARVRLAISDIIRKAENGNLNSDQTETS